MAGSFTLAFSAAAYAHAPNQTNVEAATGLWFAAKVSGASILGISGFTAAHVIGFSDAGRTDQKWRGSIYRDASNIYVRMYTPDYGGENLAPYPYSSIDAAKHYLIYGHIDSTRPTASQVRGGIAEYNGAVVATSDLNAAISPLPTTAGLGCVYINSGYEDGIDTELALEYDGICYGAGSLAAVPTTMPLLASCLGSVSFSDGSGTTITNDVAGAQNFTISGTATWNAGGVWDAPAGGGLSPALRSLLTESPMKNLVRQRDVTASQKETGIVLKSATTGLKLTGQLAANLSARYTREGQASVAITLADLASYAAAYSAGGVHEDGATASYRFDFPDAVYATGSDGATFTDIVISGANILDVEIHIELTDFAPGTVDKTGYELDSTSLTAVAGAVLDVAASSHNTANSIGAKINAADATTLLDLANAIDTGLTPRQTLRLLAAAASGDVTISGNTVTITNPLTKAKTRITATTDTSGNRVVTATDLT